MPAAFIAVSGCGGGEMVTRENPSEAMEPTYSVGDKLEVDLDAYDGSAPVIGDVVVFHPPAGADRGAECGEPHPPVQACPKPTADRSDQDFVKRVVAGPGDTLSILRRYAILNGEQQGEPFAAACGNGGACNLPKPITIPPGHYFMLGDNRGASDDSRFWGPVPPESIEGEVVGSG